MLVNNDKISVSPLLQEPEIVDQAIESKVDRVAKASFCSQAGKVLKAILTSRVVWAIGLTIGTALLLAFLASNPFGWAVAGFAASLAITGVVYIIAMAVMKKQLFFEFSAIIRMFELEGIAKKIGFKGKNYHEIHITDRDPNLPKIFLGALPNQLQREGEHLLNEENIGALLTINKRWERQPIGFSVPYADEYWKEQLGEENFEVVEFEDHGQLDEATMDRAADFIHEQMQAGHNVYVHCRAGQGRSSTAIAAYLMKYGRNDDGIPHMSFAEIIADIEGSRDIATIANKIPAMVRYHDYLIDHDMAIGRPLPTEEERRISEKYWAKRGR